MSDAEEESAHVFDRQVDARRYVETVLAHAIRTELALGPREGGSIYGWLLEGIAHDPTRRRILKAAHALAARLERAAKR